MICQTGSRIDLDSQENLPENLKDISLLLCFDEAHCLHDIALVRFDGYEGHEARTSYHCLLAALSELKPFSILTLFLSTTSTLSLHQFVPPFELQVRWGLIQEEIRVDQSSWDISTPFTEVPFDVGDLGQASPILAKEGIKTLSEMCEPLFMARFGRPL
jgi:hypothetical protein